MFGSLQLKSNRTVMFDMLRIADVLLMLAAGLLTHTYYPAEQAFGPLPLILIAAAPLVTSYAITLSGGYDSMRPFGYAHAIRSITVGGAGAALLLVVIGFSLKVSAEYSRVWLALWLACGWALLISLRLAAIWYAGRATAGGIYATRVVVLGLEPTRPALLAHLSSLNDDRIEISLDIDLDRRGTDKEALGQIANEITDYCAHNVVDDIVIAVAGGHNQLIEDLIGRLKHLSCNIGICVDQAFLALPIHTAATLGGLPLLRVMTRPIEGWSRVVKWLEDKILGVVFLLAALPFMVLIALAIKLGSRGPVLFHQQRLGLENREITVYKFRTMSAAPATDGALETSADDPRVTTVGRLLRRFSLDELPQLFNVLGGSMSLVGPRPHAVPLNWEYAAQTENYWSRHKVKPGITGWAQVNGFRGETDGPSAITGRIDYDLRYVENWSLWFDLYIIFRTVGHLLKGENAY